MISLNAKRLSRDFFGPAGSGRGACPAASKERQKSSISQNTVTISMQNSSGMGLAAQGRFYLPHSARVLPFSNVELTLNKAEIKLYRPERQGPLRFFHNSDQNKIADTNAHSEEYSESRRSR